MIYTLIQQVVWGKTESVRNADQELNEMLQNGWKILDTRMEFHRRDTTHYMPGNAGEYNPIEYLYRAFLLEMEEEEHDGRMDAQRVAERRQR